MLFDAAAEVFEKHGQVDREVNLFSGFEPWRVEERSDELINYAKSWNVDLEKQSKPFQDGAMLCEKFLTLQQGGNQIGKSYPTLARTAIEMTGELPICYKYELGVDTGIERSIYKMNIQRFGRRDIQDGQIIDYNWMAQRDGTWNCGNIIGAGFFPPHMIPPRGSKVWICTFKQALEEMWWPDFQAFIPKHLLDTKRGTNGFSNNPRRIHFLGGEVSFITYEQGFDRTEAKKVHRINLDEEPPDRRFYLGCIEHAEYMSMMFTPIRGLSWSFKDIFVPASTGSDANIALFHATQFDCPWRDPDQIKKKIGLLKPWEVEARVFGQYSEQRGKPYFDREKINRWIRRWIPRGQVQTIEANAPWVDISQLMLTEVHTKSATLDEHEKELDTWEVYEDPQENCAYWVSVDTSQGEIEGISSDDVLDRNIAYMFRPPSPEYGDPNTREDPVVVASCRSKRKVIPFARNVITACRYYNNALLASETKGETGAVLMASLFDYPFWYKMAVVNQQSRQVVNKLGFLTSKTHRQQLFDYVGDWIDRRTGNTSDIFHLPLLKELAAAVVGKGGRCDHTTTGTLDCGMAFGIGLWVYNHARLQIRDNSGFSPKPQSKKYEAAGLRPFTVEPKRPLTLGAKRARK